MKPSHIAGIVTICVVILAVIILVATLIYTNAHELKTTKTKHGIKWSFHAHKGSSGKGSSTEEAPPTRAKTAVVKPKPTPTATATVSDPYNSMVIKSDLSPEPSFYFQPGTLLDSAVPIRQRIIRGYECDCYRIPESLAFDAKQLPRRWDLFVIKPDPQDERPGRKGQVKLCIPHHSARD